MPCLCLITWDSSSPGHKVDHLDQTLLNVPKQTPEWRQVI